MHAALVVRKSTKDEQKVSLSRQEAMGRQEAQRLFPGLPVAVYADEKSGVDMERAGWLRFASDVRSGAVAGVWCYEQSRLTRAGVAAWDEICVMLWKAGITEVHTHRQGAISVAKGNRIVGGVLALVDREERDRAQLRILDAMDQLAKEGRPPGGRVYGYRSGLDDDLRKARVPVPEEAAVVNEMAERLLRGESMRSIALDLETREVPTLRGGRWSTQHIRSVVTNPTVAGLRAHRGEIVGPARWPAILERDTWERCRALLSETSIVVGVDGRERTVPRAHRRGRRYLLTGGIARCDLCGSPLIAQVRDSRNHKGRQPIYACHPITGPAACSKVSIVAEPLELWVEARLFVVLAKATTRKRRDPRARLGQQLTEVDAKLVSLAADYGADLFTRPEYLAAREATAAQAEGLRRQLDALGSDVVDELGPPAGIEAQWPRLSLMQRRAVVARYLESVTVRPAAKGTRSFDDKRVKPKWRR